MFELRDDTREFLWTKLNEIYDLTEDSPKEFALEKLSELMHMVRYSN